MRRTEQYLTPSDGKRICWAEYGDPAGNKTLPLLPQGWWVARSLPRPSNATGDLGPHMKDSSYVAHARFIGLGTTCRTSSTCDLNAPQQGRVIGFANPRCRRRPKGRLLFNGW